MRLVWVFVSHMVSLRGTKRARSSTPTTAMMLVLWSISTMATGAPSTRVEREATEDVEEGQRVHGEDLHPQVRAHRDTPTGGLTGRCDTSGPG